MILFFCWNNSNQNGNFFSDWAKLGSNDQRKWEFSENIRYRKLLIDVKKIQIHGKKIGCFENRKTMQNPKSLSSVDKIKLKWLVMTRLVGQHTFIGVTFSYIISFCVKCYFPCEYGKRQKTRNSNELQYEYKIIL